MHPDDFSGNVERFTGFADVYDRYRAGPPEALSDLITSVSGIARPSLVVDLGSGTGLSTRYWASRADQVIGIEPTPDMRAQAARATVAANVRYVGGFSHATGLAAQSVEVVTCAQALHWMEPTGTFAEAKRILRPGGVFAAFDYDWPPVAGSWEADCAYAAAMKIARQWEKDLKVDASVKQWEKEGHLSRMRDSGCFRHVKEVALHHEDSGNAERFMGLLLSQGYVAALLKRGLSEKDLGIDVLRSVADRVLGPQDRPWRWTSRVRLGVV